MSDFTFESPSVQSYLTILQTVINRMASNSSSCKTWCITLVSAILVIIANKEKPKYVMIAIVPIILFLLLDSYYLGLEKQFRTLYNEFIKKLHSNTATLEDVFILTTSGGVGKTIGSTFGALFSISIWPFYLLLGLMLMIIRYCVL